MKRRILSIFLFATLALTACAQNTLKLPAVTYNPDSYLQDAERAFKFPYKKPNVVLKDSVLISTIRHFAETIETQDVFMLNLEKKKGVPDVLALMDHEYGIIRYLDLTTLKMYQSLNMLIDARYGSFIEFIEKFPKRVQFKLLTSPSGMYNFFGFAELIVQDSYIFMHYANSDSEAIVKAFVELMDPALEHVDKEDFKKKLEEWVLANNKDFNHAIFTEHKKKSNLKKEREYLYLCGGNVADFLKGYLSDEAYVQVHNTYLIHLCVIKQIIFEEMERMVRFRPELKNETKENVYLKTLEAIKSFLPFPISYKHVWPKFQGGDANDFSKWVQERIQYPKELEGSGIHGRVSLQFTINIFGELVDLKVLRGVHPALDAEALRVVSSSPKWIPGRHIDGNIAPITYTFPVIFKPKAEEN